MGCKENKEGNINKDRSKKKRVEKKKKNRTKNEKAEKEQRIKLTEKSEGIWVNY